MTQPSMESRRWRDEERNTLVREVRELRIPQEARGRACCRNNAERRTVRGSYGCVGMRDVW